MTDQERIKDLELRLDRIERELSNLPAAIGSSILAVLADRDKPKKA